MLLATALTVTGSLAAPAIAAPATPAETRTGVSSHGPGEKFRKSKTARKTSDRDRWRDRRGDRWGRRGRRASFAYEVRSPKWSPKWGRGHYASAFGDIDWGRHRIRHDGKLFNKGKGRAEVSFLLYGRDGRFAKRGPYRTRYGWEETDFHARGRFHRILIVVCKHQRGFSKCETEVHRRKRGWD